MNNVSETTQKIISVVTSNAATKPGQTKKTANADLLVLTREAEQMGYGLSYGKYVSKTGL